MGWFGVATPVHHYRTGSLTKEFIGNHDCVGYTPEKWEEVKSFLFDTSLKDMPLQINNPEDDGWKVKVAKWRLQIGK